jgi:hypothetical protein
VIFSIQPSYLQQSTVLSSPCSKLRKAPSPVRPSIYCNNGKPYVVSGTVGYVGNQFADLPTLFPKLGVHRRIANVPQRDIRPFVITTDIIGIAILPWWFPSIARAWSITYDQSRIFSPFPNSKAAFVFDIINHNGINFEKWFDRNYSSNLKEAGIP